MSKRCKNKFSRSATSVESSPTTGCKNEKNVEAQLSAVALLLLEPINQKASDAASSIEQSLQRVGRCRNRVCGPRDSQIHVLGTKAHTTTTKRVQRLKFAVGEKINVELLQEKSSGPLWCKKTKKAQKLKRVALPRLLSMLGAECNTAITHYTAPHTLKVTVVCLPE